MNNIISVSDAFKSGCKDPERLFEHAVGIKNVTKDIDITNYVDLQNIKNTAEKTGKFGLVSSNTINFTVELPTDGDVTTVVTEGDTIQLTESFNGEDIIVATGTVQKIPTQYKNLEHTYKVTVYDRVKDGLKAKFEKNEVKLGWYVCNNAEPTQSLAHYLSEKAGIPSTEIDFEDVTDSAGTHLVIPYAHFEKGRKVMEEFSELVASVRGALFADHENRLVLTTPFNESDYDDIGFTFDTNIINEIEVDLEEAEHDQVKVTYDSFDVLERQLCWMYYKKDNYDAANDKAHMRIPAGETSSWIRVNWITPIAVQLEADAPEIEIDDDAGTDMSAYFQYDLDVDFTGGKVRFHNLSGTQDIYIQKFKIFGKPLRKLEGNETTYAEVSIIENPFEISNKFIQSEAHAEMVAKYTHHIECKDRKTYGLTAYYLPFLAISNKVGINKRDINVQATTDKRVHSANGNRMQTRVELKEFLPYPAPFSGTLETIEASYDLQSDMSDFEDEKITGGEGLPVPVPTNVAGMGSFKHVWVEWDSSTRSDLLGYNVYITHDTVLKKYFVKSNAFMFDAGLSETYNIQVSQVTRSGESNKSGSISVTTEGGVDWTEVENAAVGTEDLVDAAITAVKVATGAIDETKIADDAVDGNKIKNNIIDTAHLIDRAVNATKIALLAVGTGHIEDAAITNAKIANLAVDTANIADAAINNAKIANLAVDTAQLADAAISTAKIDNAAIIEAKIGDLAVSAAKIASAAITEAKIANLAVSTAKLKDASITNAKIKNLAVDSAKLADASVGTAKIENLAVTDAKIGSVEADKITTNRAKITSAQIEKLNADRITIGANSSFESNYNPATKETPAGAQEKANVAEGNAKAYANPTKPDGAHLWHFDRSLISTDGIKPVGTPVVTLRPNEGKFGGAVAVDKGTRNYVNADFESVFNVGSDRNPIIEVVTEESFIGDKSIKITPVDNNNSNWYLNGGEIDSSANSKVWTFSFYVKREDGKEVSTVGSLYTYLYRVSDGTKAVSTIPYKIQKCNNGWYRVVGTSYVQQEDTYVDLVGSSGLDSETSWFLDAPQLEKKPYATSYVFGSRNEGELVVPHNFNMDGQWAVMGYLKPPDDMSDLTDRTIDLVGNGYQYHAILSFETSTSGRWDMWWDDSSTVFFNISYGNTGAIKYVGNRPANFNEDIFFAIANDGYTTKCYICLEGQFYSATVTRTTSAKGNLLALDGYGGGYKGSTRIDELLLVKDFYPSEQQIKEWYNSQAPFYDPESVIGAGPVEINSRGIQMYNPTGAKTVDIGSNKGNAFFSGQVLGAVYNE